MKNNTSKFWLSFLIPVFCIIISLLCSCGSQQKDNNANKEETGMDNEEMLDEKYEVDSFETQPLCCLSDWALDKKGLNKNSFGLDAELYNAFVFIRTIEADYEIWARPQMSGSEPLVSTDSILSAIRQISTKPLGAHYAKEAEIFRTEMVWLMGHVDEWSDDRCPGTAFDRYSSFILDDKPLWDSTFLYPYYRLVDSLLLKYADVQKEIETLEKETIFNAIQQRVDNAKDFEEQCAIALVCSGRGSTYCGEKSLKLMSSLLNSGKYSVLLERMWIVWRALTQFYAIGSSRDAVIPNDMYNNVRKQIYISVLNHLSCHPKDTMAGACGISIVYDRNLIRNGSNMYGNEAMINLMDLRPYFYGDDSSVEE